MRLRNIAGSDEAIENSPYVVKDPQNRRGKWRQTFARTGPLHIEIGMGKGRFLTQLAGMNPDINYIGIERYSSVMLRAVQKLEQEERDNLMLIRMDAGAIEDVFAAGEADRIYLNFSDPWPKDRHAGRRLTSRQFLDRFGRILAPDGEIEFKTDNRKLFDFSVEELEPAGWKIRRITYDLHHDEEMMRKNIMTEYEEKFSAKGNLIYKFIIFR